MMVYFIAIWYNVWPFGVLCGPLVYFSRFGMFGPRKITTSQQILKSCLRTALKLWRKNDGFFPAEN
jgi:hypothetical protein